MTFTLHIYNMKKEILYSTTNSTFKELKNSNKNKFTYKIYPKYIIGISHPNYNEFIIKRKIEEINNLKILKYLFINIKKFYLEIENNFFNLLFFSNSSDMVLEPNLSQSLFSQSNILSNNINTSNNIISSNITNKYNKEKIYINISEEINYIINKQKTIIYYLGKGIIKIKNKLNKSKQFLIKYNLNNKTIYDFSNLNFNNNNLINDNTFIYQKYTFIKTIVPVLIIKLDNYKFQIEVIMDFKNLKIGFGKKNFYFFEIPFGYLKYENNNNNNSNSDVFWIINDIKKGKYCFYIRENINNNKYNIGNLEIDIFSVSFFCELTSISGLQIKEVIELNNENNDELNNKVNNTEIFINQTAEGKNIEFRL
ncbi:hypothetical protein CDIK_2774 [Cucumispora dikerogammari]|nr:hypothetical protein CDIK_2774 [Cucumispora dikerogammari]